MMMMMTLVIVVLSNTRVNYWRHKSPITVIGHIGMLCLIRVTGGSLLLFLGCGT